MKTIFYKFQDETTNPERPYCVEICQQHTDESTEIIECLWFKTEAEQLQNYKELTKDETL